MIVIVVSHLIMWCGGPAGTLTVLRKLVDRVQMRAVWGAATAPQTASTRGKVIEL
jgi:hypothetical protein